MAALAVTGLMGYGVLYGNLADAPQAMAMHSSPAVAIQIDAIQIAAKAFPGQADALRRAVAAAPAIVIPKSLREETRLALLDPTMFDAVALSADAGPFTQTASLDPTFVPTARVELAALEPALPPPANAEPVAPLLPPVADVDTDPVVPVPLPLPRPPEFRAPIAGAPSSVVRLTRTEPAAAIPDAPAPTPGPTFFDKLFGGPRPTGPALAYAAPEDSVVGRLQGMTSTAATNDRAATAVYDIAAHTVYLPDGTRLEAHSGLGDRLDDPRYVRDRMRGPTPPALYELTLRESLFHGVQALRLTPVAGGDTYGRGGLLAHTFMLGPRGDSNGCVVFRNYRAFLEAYARGEIRHLQVVTSLRS